MKQKISLEQLGPLLKEKRGGRGLRDLAKELEVSAATLSRVESGKQPDLDTFSKLCRWLGIDGGQILGCSAPNSEAVAGSRTLSAHFKTDRTPKPETARHLGELILTIQKALEDESAQF